MNRNSISWSGPMPAIVTPFSDTGAIDDDLLSRNIEHLLANGATGFIVGGCTGEFWAMSLEERCLLAAKAAQIVGDRGTVITATGAVTVDDTVTMTHRAQDSGCDGALILPPYFVKLSDDEIFAHYEAVSAAVEIPVMLYNIPGNAVNALTPELVDRLADLDQIVAVKESSGDWNNYYATAIAVADRLRVFCGPSSIYGVPATLLGADGTIDCFPNMWAPGGLELYYAARDGRMEEATRLQEIGRRLTDLFTTDGRTLYPSTKAAMEMLGLPGGALRRPLRPLTGAALHGLRTGLEDLGLLDTGSSDRPGVARQTASAMGGA